MVMAAGPALGLCAAGLAIGIALGYLACTMRDTGDTRELVIGLSLTTLWATVLALGLWGTLGTLAAVNAQGEADWMAASCQILSGHVSEIISCDTTAAACSTVSWDYDFDALLFHNDTGRQPSPLRVVAQQWASGPRSYEHQDHAYAYCSIFTEYCGTLNGCTCRQTWSLQDATCEDGDAVYERCGMATSCDGAGAALAAGMSWCLIEPGCEHRSSPYHFPGANKSSQYSRVS